MNARSYPPESHALRELPFEIVTLSPEHFRATLDLDRGLAPGGVVSVGALATVVDVLAGSLCGRAVAPDWMATSELSLHLGRLPTAGILHVDAGIARLGRTTLVIQITVGAGSADADSGAHSSGEGTVSFARLPRRGDNLVIATDEVTPGQRISFALGESGLSESFESAIGCEVRDPRRGLTITPVVPYIQNSFGAVNGGIVAAIADVAARALVGSLGDAQPDGDAQLDGDRGGDRRATTPVHTTALSVHYLSQVREGAVRSTATLVRDDADSAAVRVELADARLAEDREQGDDSAGSASGSWAGLMAVAHVTVARRDGL